MEIENADKCRRHDSLDSLADPMTILESAVATTV